MKEITKSWLELAKKDLATVKELINNEYLSNIAAFHAEQCIEKSFKAVLEEKGPEIPKIHDLIKLYQLIKVKIKYNIKDIESLQDLNKLYIESRYPPALGLMTYGNPSKKDIERFLSLAKAVYLKIKKELK
ncbi:MAG: HEPN domain-containing protein [Candidatus Margulisbacteria bacterium]|nr:HEPN domain-containing protein [Candidatus Margulisiibacteriota bacterium]